jgi:hypothetical protein
VGVAGEVNDWVHRGAGAERIALWFR